MSAAAERTPSRPFLHGVAGRLLIGFLTVAVVPLAAVFLILHGLTEDALRRELTARLAALADGRANQIETYFRERQRDVTALSRRPDVAEALDAFAEAAERAGVGSGAHRAADGRFRPVFRHFLETKGFSDLFLITPDGTAVFSVARWEDPGSNLYTGLWRDTQLARVFDRAKTLMGTEVSEFAFYSVTDEPAAFVAAPIFRGTRIVGVVALQVSNDSFYRVVGDFTGLGRTGETEVGARTATGATVIAPLRHDAFAAFRRTARFDGFENMPLLDAVRGLAGAGGAVDYRGQAVVAAWRYLPTLNAGMVVKMDEAEAFAPVARQRSLLLALAGGVLTLVAGAAVLVARTISRPITTLTGAARAVAAGDLTQSALVESDDEIGAFARTFNRMVADLRRTYETVEEQVVVRTEQLRRSERRLRSLLEESPVGIAVTALEDGRCLFFNRSYAAMRGLPAGEGAGEGIREGAGEGEGRGAPDVAGAFADGDGFARLTAALRAQGRIDDLETLCRRADGTVWWALIHGRPLEFEGQPALILWHYDITARVAAEGALREAKNEAETALTTLRATQESLVQAEKMASLSQLVAGVAHEINTPIGVALTAATTLARWSGDFSGKMEHGGLTKADARRFAADAVEASGLIQLNIERAAELVRGFKQVAVDQTSAERRPFELDSYIQEVLLSLRPRLKKAPQTVEVSCPPGILLDSYPGALAQVLTNLIMNSLIHAYAEGQPGRILIAAEERPDGTVELVHRDDGRGIPEADLKRVFDPFFTTRRNAGGTGLGLHIVYNIVTRTLCGTIAVDSRPGEGTAFTLRFPANPLPPAPGPAPEDRRVRSGA